MRERRRQAADIGIAYDAYEPAAILQALDNIRAAGLVKSSDVVVITPNWVQQKTPDTAVVVGPESLREIIRFVKNQNPRRIVVATGSGQKDTGEIMSSIGFDRIIREEEVEFADLNKGPFTKVKLNHHSPSSTMLNKLYNEMTFLISFTQLKYHQEATVSAAIKNIALSWPPASEHGHPKKLLGIHDDLHGFIRAMAEIIPIDLSIVSLSPAMVGTGPSGGVPVSSGLVICGTDPVAIDTIGARYLGFKPQAIRYLFDCINDNLGLGKTGLMNVYGMNLEDSERVFSTAAYNREVILDKAK